MSKKTPASIYHIFAPRQISVFAKPSKQSEHRGTIIRGEPLHVVQIQKGWYFLDGQNASGWASQEDLPEITRAVRAFFDGMPSSVIRASAQSFLLAAIHKATAPDDEYGKHLEVLVKGRLDSAKKPLDLLLRSANLMCRGSSQARQDLLGVLDAMNSGPSPGPRPRNSVIGLGSKYASKRRPLGPEAIEPGQFGLGRSPCLLWGSALGRIFGGIARAIVSLGKGDPEEPFIQDELYKGFTKVNRLVKSLEPLETALRWAADVDSDAGRKRFLQLLETIFPENQLGDFPNTEQIDIDFGPNPDDSGWPVEPVMPINFCRLLRNEMLDRALHRCFCLDRYKISAITNQTAATLGARVCRGEFAVIEGSGFGEGRELWEASGTSFRNHVVFPGRGGEPVSVMDDASYLEPWTDGRIVVRVPTNAVSGQVELIVKCEGEVLADHEPCNWPRDYDDSDWVFGEAPPDWRPRYLLILNDAASLEFSAMPPLPEACLRLTLQWNHRYLRGIVLSGPGIPDGLLERSYLTGVDFDYQDGVTRPDFFRIERPDIGMLEYRLEGTTICGERQTASPHALTFTVNPSPLAVSGLPTLEVGSSTDYLVRLPCEASEPVALFVTVTPLTPMALADASIPVSIPAGVLEARFTLTGRRSGRVRVHVEQSVPSGRSPRYSPGSVEVIITPFIIDVSPPPREAWVNQVLTVTGHGFHSGALVQFRRAAGGGILASGVAPLTIDSGSLRVRIPESIHPEVMFEVVISIDGRESNASPPVRLRRAVVTLVTEQMDRRWRIDGHGFSTSTTTNLVRFFAPIDGRATELAVVTAVEPGIDGDHFFLTSPRPCLAGPGITFVVEPEGMLPTLPMAPPRLGGRFQPVGMELPGLRDSPRIFDSPIGPFTVRAYIEGIGGLGPDCQVSAKRRRPTDPASDDFWPVTVPSHECNLSTDDGAAALPGACHLLVFWSYDRPTLRDPGTYHISVWDALTGRQLGSGLGMEVKNVFPGPSPEMPGHAFPATLLMSPDNTLLMAVGAGLSRERSYHIWDLANDRHMTDETDLTVSARVAHEVVGATARDVLVVQIGVDDPPTSLPLAPRMRL